jgi:aminopeptidase N
VIDQWFSVQAACPRAGALARVELLERHADFDGRNPNRLRALYGTFAGQNPVSFHARDGSGYRFLAERVARKGGQAKTATRLYRFAKIGDSHLILLVMRLDCHGRGMVKTRASQ